MFQYAHNGFSCQHSQKWSVQWRRQQESVSFENKKFKYICLLSHVDISGQVVCVRWLCSLMFVGFLYCLFRSLVLSFWACDLSVSLSTPMLQSPWLSLTGRRSGGVWGKWWRLAYPHSVLILFMALFSYLLYFLMLCIFAFFS